MDYICHYCEKATRSAHSIPVYDHSGKGECWEVLCNPCYADWLLSMKG